MNNKYLPIGTVVILNGGSKKAMITGYQVHPVDNEKKKYDYRGCPFPEGVMRSKGIVLFNANQIKEICHMGWECDESIDFLDKLEYLVDTMKK